jgi:hypothetical protein
MNECLFNVPHMNKMSNVSIIDLLNLAGNTNQRNRLAQTTGYIRGGIRGLGGASIPC